MKRHRASHQGLISNSLSDLNPFVYDSQKALEDAGFTVLRFEDDEVLFSINSVYQQIKPWINEKEARLVHPLNPPPAGDIVLS